DAEDLLARASSQLRLVPLLAFGVEAARAMQRSGGALREQQREGLIGRANGGHVGEAHAKCADDFVTMEERDRDERGGGKIEVERVRDLGKARLVVLG